MIGATAPAIATRRPPPPESRTNRATTVAAMAAHEANSVASARLKAIAGGTPDYFTTVATIW
jgi:hypothetical protein